jgi:hypothetical protein
VFPCHLPPPPPPTTPTHPKQKQTNKHQTRPPGILNDMGSGSHVDMCIIHAPDGRVEYRRDVRRAPSSSNPTTTTAATTAAERAGEGAAGDAKHRRTGASFLQPRGALAAAAGPKVERAAIHGLVGGRMGRGDVQHEPLRPFRCVFYVCVFFVCVRVIHPSIYVLGLICTQGRSGRGLRLHGVMIGRRYAHHTHPPPPHTQHRRRELRFCHASFDQKETETEASAALSAVAAALAVSKATGLGPAVGSSGKGAVEPSPASASTLGFEVHVSGSPDEDVEVL